MEERRVDSVNILRELRNRSQLWNALQRLAAIDVIATVALTDKDTNERVTLEQFDQVMANLRRKLLSSVPASVAGTTADPAGASRPEAGAPVEGAGCSPLCPPPDHPQHGRTHVLECPRAADASMGRMPEPWHVMAIDRLAGR